MKAEIRASAMHDVGVRLDDMLEASRSEIGRAEGRLSAFSDSAKVPLRLAEAVKAEVDAGRLDLSVADVVISWLTKTSTALENLSKAAAMEKVAAAGKASGLKAAVELTKALHARESAILERVEEIAAAPAPSAETPPAESVRAPPIKLRRLAEETKATPKKGRRHAANT